MLPKSWTYWKYYIVLWCEYTLQASTVAAKIIDNFTDKLFLFATDWYDVAKIFFEVKMHGVQVHLFAPACGHPCYEADMSNGVHIT